jgi:hypothetical protein
MSPAINVKITDHPSHPVLYHQLIAHADDTILPDGISHALYFALEFQYALLRL